ncbi:MAG: glycosyltransferase family protein [Candidatus Woesearchaeota archaeon]
MARILYTVNGEGMGHAVRSSVVIEYLKQKNHDIVVVSGGRAFDFLSKRFSDVYDIECYNIVYKNNRAMNIDTLFLNAKKFPKIIVKNFNRLFSVMIKFKPDIIITDFEPFSNFISKFFGIPVIAIDNISIINKARIKSPPNEISSFLTAVFVTKTLVKIDADKYIIPTFFYPKLKDSQKCVFVSPVIREEILRIKTSKKKHILVYQTSPSNKELLKTLKRIRYKFIVYGFDKEKTEKNIVFKKFNEKRFIKDLATSKGVIVNGGFSVISEALYLKKPILSIPIRNQFEQILNANYVKMLGYGDFSYSATKEAIENFLKRLNSFESVLKDYKHDNNKKLFIEVDKAIKELLKNKNKKQKK